MKSKINLHSFILASILSIYFIFGKTSIFVGIGFIYFLYTAFAKKRNNRSVLFLILLFLFYAFVYQYTERTTTITLVDQVSLLGPQFLMAALFASAITTKEEFVSSVTYLTYVLFVSFVLIGFYQYFTQTTLASWVNEADVVGYTVAQDLQRLTSLTEMHPANTANGILFIIILLLERAFARKIDAVVMIIAAMGALLLTFTRMSYITLVIVLGYYFYKQYGATNKASHLLKRIFGIAVILGIALYVFDVPSLLSQSSRVGDEGNAIYRFIQWAYFIQNINLFLFGVGYSNVNATSVMGKSYENYFMQTFAAIGIFAIVLYAVIFRRFIRNLKTYRPDFSSYRLSIMLMMIAFNINMLTATESENLFFLVFGLSFAFYNVSTTMKETSLAV